MPVVDASVWVSLCHAGDRFHRRSLDWLETALAAGERLAAPTLLRVEVAAAIRRLTGKEELGAAALVELEESGVVDLVPLDAERSDRAARIALRAAVRGADAVYLELALDRGEPLVTWDRQQLDRGGAVTEVRRP